MALPAAPINQQGQRGNASGDVAIAESNQSLRALKNGSGERSTAVLISGEYLSGHPPGLLLIFVVLQ